GKTKTRGTMFAHTRSDEQISDSWRWLHIGDNLHSDVRMEKENSIICRHFQMLSAREDTTTVRTLGDSIVRAIQLNHKFLSEPKDYWYRFGFDVVGPVYIGLSFWLKEKLLEEDNIYFLSRDGYIPHLLYSKLREVYESLPEGKYLYASRRGYIYPQLILEKDSEKIVEVLMLYNSGLGQELTLAEILENLGLEQEVYRDTIKGVGFDDVIADHNITEVRQFLLSIL